MHYLSSVYFANRPTDIQLKSTTHISLLCIYYIPPDDGLQICPKHAEIDWRNKLRINSASSWFWLYGCIEMHGQQNIKYWCIIIIVIESIVPSRNIGCLWVLCNSVCRLLRTLVHSSFYRFLNYRSSPAIFRSSSLSISLRVPK